MTGRKVVVTHRKIVFLFLHLLRLFYEHCILNKRQQTGWRTYTYRERIVSEWFISRRTRVACVIVLDTPPISTTSKEQKKKVKLYENDGDATHQTERFNRNNRMNKNSFVSFSSKYPEKKWAHKRPREKEWKRKKQQ